MLSEAGLRRCIISTDPHGFRVLSYVFYLQRCFFNKDQDASETVLLNAVMWQNCRTSSVFPDVCLQLLEPVHKFRQPHTVGRLHGNDVTLSEPSLEMFEHLVDVLCGEHAPIVHPSCKRAF